MLKKEMVQNMHSFVEENNTYKKDGITYCSKCNTAKVMIINGKKLSILCECAEKERDKEERERQIELEQERFKKLRETSLIGERYKETTFDSTNLERDKSFIIAFNRCKKFCENINEVINHGYGIYMWGESGTGKSHLMACMVNELTRKGIPCLFTNFFEISKAIKNTFNNKNESEINLINKIANIPVLFIDDFGTERVQSNGDDNWLQGQIYDVINKRYNSMNPTIFSSNLTLKNLVEEKGIMEKTVDRIFEMSNVAIEIKGKSYRFDKNIKNLPY